MASAADIGDSNTWALSHGPFLKSYNSKDTSITTQEASMPRSGVYGCNIKNQRCFYVTSSLILMDIRRNSSFTPPALLL